MKSASESSFNSSRQARGNLVIDRTGLLFIVLILQAVIISCRSSNEYSPGAERMVPQKSSWFTAGEVRLLDGPFRESQDAEAKYLLSLDLDRLLSPFLRESGLTPRAAAYPGWETRSLPGVALSFYLSGASRLYKLTDDPIFLKNLDYLLEQLKICQAKNGGYLLGSRGGKEVFKKLETDGYYPEFSNWGQGHGEPYYVMEKLFSGLIDAYRIGGRKTALGIATGLADWLGNHMSYISDAELQQIMDEEYGGMNWVLSDMYVITGNKKYLAMSERWQDDHVTIPLTKEVDILSGIHANTQFPKMSGLAARYPYTGDQSDLKGASFFWDRVVNHRTYVTGGNSESEYFWPLDTLSNKLSPFTEENCNVYNMLKLTSLLYSIEPKAEFADFMERALFNHLLPAQNPDDGRVCYHLPLMSGAEKYYRPLYDEFSCCICSGLDSYTRHAEYIYAHSDSDLFVNQFIASELKWKKKGITIRQETEFPYQDNSSLKITCNRETGFGLRIRIPSWLKNSMTISINGESSQTAIGSGYFTIRRIWKSGDVVKIQIPMNLRSESMPDNKKIIAFFYGPVLLAGTLDTDYASSLVAACEQPALMPGKKEFSKWLTNGSSPLEFSTTIAQPREISLKPFFKVRNGPYSVYWKIVDEEELKKINFTSSKKSERLREMDKQTFDLVRIGDEKSEKSHNLTGNSTTGKGNMGIFKDENWRSAEPGTFSYTMNIPDNETVALLCKFMGRRQNETWDCRIRVDTTTIAIFKRAKDDTYPVIPFYYAFNLPETLTKKRNSVKIELTGGTDGQMPRLMEIRTIKKKWQPVYPVMDI